MIEFIKAEDNSGGTMPRVKAEGPVVRSIVLAAWSAVDARAELLLLLLVEAAVAVC